MTRRAYRPSNATRELVRRIEAVDGVAEVRIHAPHGGTDPKPAFLIVTLEARNGAEPSKTSFSFSEARAWLASEEGR